MIPLPKVKGRERAEGGGMLMQDTFPAGKQPDGRVEFVSSTEKGAVLRPFTALPVPPVSAFPDAGPPA